MFYDNYGYYIARCQGCKLIYPLSENDKQCSDTICHAFIKVKPYLGKDMDAKRYAGHIGGNDKKYYTTLSRDKMGYIDDRPPIFTFTLVDFIKKMENEIWFSRRIVPPTPRKPTKSKDVEGNVSIYDKLKKIENDFIENVKFFKKPIECFSENNLKKGRECLKNIGIFALFDQCKEVKFINEEKENLEFIVRKMSLLSDIHDFIQDYESLNNLKIAIGEMKKKTADKLVQDNVTSSTNPEDAVLLTSSDTSEYINVE